MGRILSSSALVFLLTLTRCSSLCPEICKCDYAENLLTSDCSSSSLKDVPNQLDNRTTTLDLSYNHITILKDNTFKNEGILLVNNVYLQNNDIRSINPQALQGLSNLSELYLQNNVLTFIDSETFVENQKLRILNLNNNNIMIFPNITLKNLEYLTLQFNDIPLVQLQNVVNQFPSIKKLDLSWNRITELNNPKNTTQSRSLTLKEVDLSNNKIVEISEYVFLSFPNLIQLNLSTNALRFQNSSKYFQQNSKLKILDLSFNKINYLHPDIFKFLNDLEEILLHLNSISLLPRDIFRNNSCLTRAIMKYNNIRVLPPDIFYFNPLLQEVDLSFNYIKTIHPDTFFRNPFLTNVYLSHLCRSNSLCEIGYLDPTTFNENDRLLELDISYNRIKEIHPETFIGNPFLKILNFRGNEIEFLHGHVFRYITSLQNLYLGNNSLKYLNVSIFNENRNLLDIDLSSNMLPNLNLKIFENNINLQALNLSFNTVSFGHDYVIIFESLKVLDVSYCNITELPSDLFAYLPNLRQLILKGNKLTNTDNSLNSVQNSYLIPTLLKNIQILDLSNNYLERIDVKVLCNKEYLKHLNIISNPLICDCSLNNIWEWCKKYKIDLIATPCDIMCNNSLDICGNETHIYNSDFSKKEFDILPPEYPDSQEPTLSMTITFIILFTVVALILIGWLYPLCYKQKKNRSDEYELGNLKNNDHKSGTDFLLYPDVHDD